MMLRRGAGAGCVAATAALVLLVPQVAAHPDHEAPTAKGAQAGDDVRGRSTVDVRLVGSPPSEGYARLQLGAGEPYVVRDDLTRPRPGRAARRRSIVYLAQLSDFQISDEQSPARVEFLDRDPSEYATSAWRPQEAMVTHQVEMTIRQVNRFRTSPIRQGDRTRARMLNAVLTGDQADNQQLNESEWVLRLLAGGEIDPSSGTQDVDHPLCPPSGAFVRDHENPRQYTGVQDYRDYLVPDPIFYDPQDVRGIYAERGWPRYPNLMDRAQSPFTARGLDVPSYVAFGNHDLLVQGNAWASAAYELIATGCVKPLISLGDAERPLDFAQNPAGLLSRALTERDRFMLVPRDPRRRLLDKREYKELHRITGQQDMHGFAHVDQDELEASDGAASYYAFTPRRGLRYVVLDTVSMGGIPGDSSNGNIDAPQFAWLERELRASQRRGELVLIFAHHALESLSSQTPDENAPPCTTEGRDPNPGCDRDPRLSTPLRHGEDLLELMHRHPNAIALIAGHSHENKVAAHPRGDGGGFWEIKSPAVVDWPTQHRLVEVMNNRDGTLSIFGTMLDHAGSASGPDPGDASGFSVSDLAALGRVLAFNDPQVGPAEPGDEEPGPEGTPVDRNVELLIRDPRAAGPAQAGRPRVRLSSTCRRVRVTGAGVRNVRRVVFHRPGMRRRVDRNRPFRVAWRRAPRVRAAIHMRDGRRVVRRANAPRCAPRYTG